MGNKSKINYFRILKKPLRLLGISLKEDDEMSYKIYSFIILSSCLSYGAILLTEIFKHDFHTLINTLLYQVSVLIAIIKIIVVLRNRFKIGKLLDVLEERPFLPNSERGGEVEEKLVNECVWITNFQATAYWAVVLASTAFGVTIAIIKRIRNPASHEFPYGPITIVNVTYSPNFDIVLSYQILSMTCYGGYFCGIDLLAATALAHISCQFRMLQNYIKNIVKLSYNEMLKDTNIAGNEVTNFSNKADFDASLIPWKYLKKGLTNIVEYHLAIINIVQELENIFSGLLLVVFVGSLGMISLMVYRISLISFNDSRITAAIGESLIGCGQTIVICFWGQQVINESQLVANAVFEMDFSGTDVRFQKGLVLLIGRSQKPVALTAKRFTIIGLSTFAWIMQKSYTAYMVLQKANSQETQNFE